jgi:rSAM-associated Gly-rich repeat protein
MSSNRRSIQALAALLQTGATGLSIGLAAADAAAATSAADSPPADKSIASRLEAIRGSVSEAWKEGLQNSEPHVAVDPETKLAWWGNGWHNGGWHNGGWHNGGWHNGGWGNGGWHNGGWGNGGWHNGGWGNGGLVGAILSPLVGGGWHNGWRNW